MFFTSYSQGAWDNLASMGDLSLAQMKNLAEIAQKYFYYGVNNYVHMSVVQLSKQVGFLLTCHTHLYHVK